MLYFPKLLNSTAAEYSVPAKTETLLGWQVLEVQWRFVKSVSGILQDS